MRYCFSVLIILSLFVMPVRGDDLLTVAESSNFKKTSLYDDVVDLLGRIDAASSVMTRLSMGKTVEERDIPLVVLANPPITSAEEVLASGKLVCFVFANIHAGEVCGKEAALMLIREIALDPKHELLENTVLLFAPIYNADGNERLSPDNRRGQNGPDEMGQRPNADGLDLNRDYIKLEAPETRALVGVFNEWNPHLTMDLHTTNGSVHRYTMTFDTPLHPNTPAAINEFLRGKLIPSVQTELMDVHGYDSFYYGNFNRDRTAWFTYSALARYGGSYQGLRGQMQVLSEAYAYASFEDRVLCTRAFVREVLTHAVAHQDEVIEIVSKAQRDIALGGQTPQPDDLFGLRYAPQASLRHATVHAFERDGSTPLDVDVIHMARFRSTRSVARPYGYVLDANQRPVIDNLRAHGINVEPFEGTARVEVMMVDEITRPQRPFQGHHLNRIETTTHTMKKTIAPGSFLVRTSQPLGNLIVYLLEPECEDGLAAWNFFDDSLEEGQVFPVMRVRLADDLQLNEQR